MSTATVHPGVVEGTLRVPGSKSFTHRAYVLAARSDRPVTIAQPLRAADPDATLACLHALGARVAMEERTVTFEPAAWGPPRSVLDCRNAGTGLRLLAAQAATQPFPVVLDGDASLRTRPNLPLLEALRMLGADAQGDAQGRAPLRVQGPMRAGDAFIPARASSQFASALLLGLPLLEGISRLHLAAPLRSAPYLDITLQVLDRFGIRVDAAQNVGDDGGSVGSASEFGAAGQVRTASDAGDGAVRVRDEAAQSQPAAPAARNGEEKPGRTYTIAGKQVPRCDAFTVPADWSTAAFPLAAAAITGGRVRVLGPRADDPQGDRAIGSLLASFGARVRVEDEAVEVEGGPLVSPGTIDVGATPDLFPALCAVAAVARGVTTFTGGESLRHKECDRIAAMAAGLDAMGVENRQRPDGLVVHGLGSTRRPRAAVLATQGDHRIHMALAVLALAADGPSTLDEGACVAVSYPSFHGDLADLQEGRSGGAA